MRSRDIGIGLLAMALVAGACQAGGASPATAQGSAPGELSTAAAMGMVDRYERALTGSDPQTAWSLLSPTFRATALDSDPARFAAERATFIASAGTTYSLVVRSTDPAVLRQWALPRLTADADLSQGYLVEAHYPALSAAYPSADPTCASDIFVVAPSTAGGWYLWWVGDAAALSNGSCTRSPSLFSPQPGPAST